MNSSYINHKATSAVPSLISSSSFYPLRLVMLDFLLCLLLIWQLLAILICCHWTTVVDLSSHQLPWYFASIFFAPGLDTIRCFDTVNKNLFVVCYKSHGLLTTRYKFLFTMSKHLIYWLIEATAVLAIRLPALILFTYNIFTVDLQFLKTFEFNSILIYNFGQFLVNL